MRPVVSDQAFIRFPFDELLGTAAQVRLLRLLCEESAGAISAPRAAARSGLTAAGARRALRRLVRTGFVVRSGEGRSQQFAVRQGDPLVDALRALFAVERQRFEKLLNAIRESIAALVEIQVAWLPHLPVGVGEPLDLSLITDSRSLSNLPSEVRRSILPVEQTFDVTVEIHAFTPADAPPVDWRNAILVAGVPPSEGGRAATAASTHSDRESRSLRLSEAIAGLLDRDPSLVQRAVVHVDRVLREEPGAASRDLLEWRDVLKTYSPERLKRFLVAESSRASRLRQSSPFFAVLSPDERDRIVASLEQGR
jgi:hypothetical protein